MVAPNPRGTPTGPMTSEVEARVLVVEDEPAIAELVATALRYEGFEARISAGGRDALRQVAAHRPELVVLDVMLPDLDGLEVARRLRAASNGVPIIFLTARDAAEDRIRGLSVGVDDYLAKPFSIEELVLRVRAILRRSRPAAPRGRLAFADLVLDEESHEVVRAGTPVELTPTEFSLLRFLLGNQGRVVTKAQILDHVWRYDYAGGANVVETYISYLRRKLDPLGPGLIHTVRGVGYRLRSPAP